MRFLYLFVFFIFCLYSHYRYNNSSLFDCDIPSVSPPPCPNYVVQRTFFSYNFVTIDLMKIIFLIFLWAIFLLLNIIRINVRHVNFIWNLSILPRRYETIFLVSHTFKMWVYIGTFMSLYEPFLLVFAIDKTFLLYFPRKNTLVAFNKCLYSKIHSTCFLTFKHLIMSIVVFISTFLTIPCATTWYFQLVIYLSNDISKNPGPHFQNNFFNFMSWNINSLAKDNFHRVSLKEAHNSCFNYNLISICETSLNDSVRLPETVLDEYTFVPVNNLTNTRRGGVGLFYRNSLPLIIRNDLSFGESIVVEVKFGRKKIFFTVLYRSSAHNSPNFQAFLSDFTNLYSNIKAENPFATFFTGGFNAHSQYWWPGGNTTPEGSEIEHLLSNLGLSQVICEPTNFEPNKKPSCIDLVITDQPNLILDSGTRASLDPYCHHQIIYCKVNFRIPPSPPLDRKIWHFNRANSAAIKSSMTNFPWLQHLNLNTDANWQVKTFTDIFLNIMSNFIPNEIKRFVPRDPPWITKPIKTLLNRKNRFFKNYKKHGYKREDRDRLDTFRMECQQAVPSAKLTYLQNLGNKANDPRTSQKSYWKIINRVMNKCRAPKIPPLFVNNMFILNCCEKAKSFNDWFSEQCTPIINNSVLPPFHLLTDKKIDHISIQCNEITSLIRNLNPNKATGSDEISGQMLLLCDNSVVLPLKIIFENILATSTYPDIWKLANVTPIFKKGDKQLIKNYRPISLLPICGKIFEKIIFNNLYKYLHANNLITKNQSGFRPGDSTSNQLLYLINEIHEAFDDPKSLEVCAVFLDI